MFYSAFVVPIGGYVIGVTEQGAVTANVTFWLNMIGTLNVGILATFVQFPKLLGRKVREAFPVLESLDRPKSLQTKHGIIIVLGVAQFLLWVLSFRLNQEFDSSRIEFRDQDAFYFWHRLYLWVTIIQMWCGLWWLALVSRIFPNDVGKGL